MTHQPRPAHLPATADAGRQIAQLRHLLGLVEQIAGGPRATPAPEAALDESARISAAYEEAMPIQQRRFDTLAAETASWAALGVRALIKAKASGNPRAAAGRLALELEQALSELTAMLRR